MRKCLDTYRMQFVALGKDENAVVSFEYVIAATCVIVVVIAIFQGGSADTISGALSAGVGHIMAAISALSS